MADLDVCSLGTPFLGGFLLFLWEKCPMLADYGQFSVPIPKSPPHIA